MYDENNPSLVVDYAQLAGQAGALRHGEPSLIANAANFAALLFHSIPDLNWAGWYVVRGDWLVVGPFQGRPACIRIARGDGVCGTAWATGISQRVDDVLQFPGHIPCDSASRSELVVPLFAAGVVRAVLDLDSPKPGRFTAQDQAGLENLAAAFAADADWAQL